MDFRDYLGFLGEYSLPSDGPGVAYVGGGSQEYKTPNDFTRPDSPGAEVPAAALGLPSVTKRGRVVGVRYRPGGVANVALEDGTVVRLTTGQVKLVKGAPLAPGNTLTVVFQRLPGYSGREDSQIMSIRCEAGGAVRQEP